MTEVSGKNGFVRLHISLHGAVQGVGFRPFVYRLAVGMNLKGWVLNSSQGVFIEIEGGRESVDDFTSRLQREKPARAYIQGMETSFLDPVGFKEFEIKESEPGGVKSALVIPDIAICPECATEILDPANRRYLYPFTNCTNCGPRFSIMRALPYDRPNTTMAGFMMCEKCLAEYSDPSNRRFHAQPNACPDCGPHLELWDESGAVLESRSESLFKAAQAVRDGKIVALKGIGGFQLLADARNDEAVARLRERKHREEKPFALMFPAMAMVKQYCEVSGLEERLLSSPEGPIVLVRRLTLSRLTSVVSGNSGGKTLTRLSPSLAPRNPYLGVMLPYTPLHLILMRELGFPVVATSGNISEEPICIDEHEALERLGGIADLLLVHNRPIERQVDDSVVRVVSGRAQVIRRARGYAPFPVEVEGISDHSVLAVGGHLKNTIAVNAGDNVFISQHIGDLSTEGARRTFEKTVSDFQRLYEITPEIVVHDLHPDYSSSQFADQIPGHKLAVQHHFAHVAACMAENRLEGPVLGVSWDGTGLGDDRTIWGGEFLLVDGDSYERVATLRSFRLPGGETSIKEPRRTALGVLYEIFGDEAFELKNLPPVREFDAKSLSVLKKMLYSGFNSPVTTSAGRLFDAVSSILGIRQAVSFEGQGAMELEFAADGQRCEETYGFEIVRGEKQEGRSKKLEMGSRKSEAGNQMPEAERPGATCAVVDWRQMIREIVAEVSSGANAGLISVKFHNTLAEIIVEVANRIARDKVVLTGGCFQNRYLSERTVERLRVAGFKPYWHQLVPPNDGGISLGQMFVATRREREYWNDESMIDERSKWQKVRSQR